MNPHPQHRRIHRLFRTAFGEPELLVRSPGRVNLIGEHTDFNLGFVLPAAIDRGLWFAFRRRADEVVRLGAADLQAEYQGVTREPRPSGLGWPDYLLGVYAELALDGMLPGGVDCIFGGDVPVGSGLSSSAALTCGFAFGLNELFGLGLDRGGLARLGQRVENRFVGVHCGIMDQFASLMGRERCVVLLDCRDLSHRHVPFVDPDLRVVLCDSGVRRSLASGGEYNARRAQCEAGVALLRERHPIVESLRDATLAMLDEGGLEPLVHRRCAYVVRENARVLEACACLDRRDPRGFGQRMNESHAGLRDEYQVSCPELDMLAEGAQAIPGVLGSRMMGAGFGGCTINLVREAALPEFEARMAEIYAHRLRREPLWHACRLTGGTEVVG